MTSIVARRGLPIVSAFIVLACVLCALPSRSTAQTSYLVEEVGDANGAQLGRALAAAGDLNGDGYVDFVVGEPQDGSMGSGRVHVYLGGAAPHKEPLLDLGADLSVASFGRSLAAGEDVNHDGYPDILVGAQDAAYVYFGGPAMDNLPDLTLDVPSDAVDFGAAVAWVRDLDGDGFADAVVGAPGGQGHAYVFRGAAQPNVSMDLRLNPSAAYPTFGTRVISAGDVNADGYDDLLIAEPKPTGTGAAFLYLGSASPDAVPDLYLTGGDPGDQFSAAIAAGDLNADGYSDVIIGLPYHSSPGMTEDSGKVLVYFGGPQMDNGVDIGLTGEAPSGIGEHFGAALDCTGDVNGDGYPDLLVGAPYYLDSVNQGRACLFFGGPTIHLTADRVLTNGDAWFGIAVARAGDVDADGSPDLLVGAPQFNDNGGQFVLASGQTTVGVADGTPRFSFLAPVPNPAGDRTQLVLHVERAGPVVVEAFDVAGRRVAKPVDLSAAGPGPVTSEWNLSGLPAGLYFLRARLDGQEQVRRLVHVNGP